MPRLAVDDDLVTLAGEGFFHGHGRRQLIPALVERDHVDAATEAHLSGVRLELARQHLEQCRLARAIRADDPDAVAASNAGREILTTVLPSKAFDMPLASMTRRPDGPLSPTVKRTLPTARRASRRS